MKMKRAILLVLGMALFATSVLTVSAAATRSANPEIGYYVQAGIPDNQIDTSLSYFDLKMEPGMKQTLQVEVANTTDQMIVVDAAVISASTNRNGVIDYKTPDIRDSSLKIPFSEIATLRESQILVPANWKKVVFIDIVMPETQYDGVVLGGIVFSKNPASQQQAMSRASNQMEIQNVYSYVIGVKLSETDVLVKPEFELFEIKAQVVNYQPAVVHFIRNKKAAIVKGMSLSLQVYKADTKEQVAEVEKDGLDMALNSVMPLAVSLDGLELKPGSYYTELSITTQDGMEEDFRMEFVIEAEEANEVNDGSIIPDMQKTLIPIWLLILILVCFILLLGIIIFLLLLLAKRRKEEKEAPQEQGAGNEEGHNTLDE